MTKDEIITRLKRIAKQSVHIPEEKPFVMSLDDGIAVYEAIKIIESEQPDLSSYSDKLWRAAYERGKAEAEQRWIPCSERVPERKDINQMRGYYLTTNGYGSVNITKYEFEGGGLGYAWNSDIQIVAWMPLPEPYKEEGEE